MSATKPSHPPKYDTVVIIYNPNSTSGQADKRAHRLAKRLEHHGFRTKTLPTEYAGHAEELAYDATRRYEHPLLVSVSGDGGYNEVINGVMHAKQDDPNCAPVCALMAAGNANDHRRTIRKHPLTWAIRKTQPEQVDILRMTISKAKTPIVRYAHSYIGFGFTSQAAAQLNREELTPWKEVKIVIGTILNFHALRIITEENTKQTLASLVFANIHQMSKVVKMGKRTNLHDGLFRVVALPYRNRHRLFFSLLSIAIVGFRNPPQTSAYEFRVLGNELAHLDGEVIPVPGGSRVRVEAEHEALLIIR